MMWLQPVIADRGSGSLHWRRSMFPAAPANGADVSSARLQSALVMQTCLFKRVPVWVISRQTILSRPPAGGCDAVPDGTAGDAADAATIAIVAAMIRAVMAVSTSDSGTARLVVRDGVAASRQSRVLAQVTLERV